MFSKTSFLKNPNANRRHLLQLEGFLSLSNLSVAADLLKVENFELPAIPIFEEYASQLTFSDNLRLGNRLEKFFSFVIQKSTSYSLAVENFQIVENKITLGEIDFLLRNNQSNQLFHIELATKLYLYDSTLSGELERWVGPNRKDSLLQKIEKLKAHQFPLLYTSQAKNDLSAKGIDPTDCKQKICFKAKLFLPFAAKDILPPFVKNKNIDGYFTTFPVFQGTEFKNQHYFLPEKQDWIVPPKYGERWFSHDEIKLQIEKMHIKKQSPMVWMKKDNNTFETIFVVFW